MKLYSKQDIEQVKKFADITDFVPGISAIGKKLFARCPKCGKGGKEGLELIHNSRTDLGACRTCGHYIKGAVDAVQQYQDKNFREAIKIVADRYGLKLDEIEIDNKTQGTEEDLRGTFVLKQLEASGLTLDDVTARVKTPDGKGYIRVPTFQKGSLTYNGNINSDDDEMLIHYYDLYGSHMMYATRGAAGAPKPYVRVRWSNPDAHISKEGKPTKYQTAKGADVRFYIPDAVREAFRNETPIETLVIQEGEKKAEKACKHGILSLGIQGIYNIGNKDSGLIKDLQYIANKCKVKNIILLFDSDWDHLHSSLKPGDAIDQRPNQFARAAIKFRNYVDTLRNADIFVDIWFGHLKENANGEKGIDDLLTGSLKGSENLFLEDMERTLHTHDGHGTYADFHKISILSDTQIMDFWDLRDKEKFFDRYKDRITDLQRFKFGKIVYVKDDSGKIIASTNAGQDARFWAVEYEETKSGKTKKNVEFDMLTALSFLEANGFARIKSAELGEMSYGFVSIENKIARIVPDFEIRDFVWEYIAQNCKDKDVLNFVIERLGTILGRDRLERLKRFDMSDVFEPDYQLRYFRNGQCRITADDIEFGPILSVIWDEAVQKRQFSRVPIIEDISVNASGSFDIRFSPAAEECEFLQYLRNTSWFWKGDGEKPEWDTFYLHLVNKITAMGFLLTDYKFHSEDHAIIAMDAKMSEVGQSCGRSGKSLFGWALANVVSQAYIDGKALQNNDDYMFTPVTPRSRNIFIDDVKPNFNFTRLFSSLSGPLNVNPKSMAQFQLPYEKAPRIFISTNHAINDNTPSAKDRMRMVLFSDWYNIDHKPKDDFGHEFFSEWDARQWELFDNLMAECVMYFMRSRRDGWVSKGCGVVPPPMQRVEMRQLRQTMGEAFLQWAEVYFDESNTKLNNRCNRLEMYNDFCTDYPGQRQFVTSSNFRTKLIAFCQYSGLHLNAHKKDKDGQTFEEWIRRGGKGSFIGDRDNSGGVIYFTVMSDDYARQTLT